MCNIKVELVLSSFSKLHVNDLFVKFVDELEVLFGCLTDTALEIKFSVVVSGQKFENFVFESAFGLDFLLRLVSIFIWNVFLFKGITFVPGGDLRFVIFETWNEDFKVSAFFFTYFVRTTVDDGTVLSSMNFPFDISCSILTRSQSRIINVKLCWSKISSYSP